MENISIPYLNSDAKLKVHNSFTRQKDEFIPKEDNKISWYSCGPTVYDASHMGHARSYISFDILRRVLSNYFKYEVQYVMNITDIDDKIIKRARQKYLFDQYTKQERSIKQTIHDVKLALKLFESKETADQDKAVLRNKLAAETRETLVIVEASLDTTRATITAQDFASKHCEEVLSEWLDNTHGANVNDNSIFTTFPRKWEDEFHNDMDALNVLRPDVETRVSEYIPQIIAYIIKIIENGMAYESKGSVYFNTIKFDKCPNHSYAKLVPEAFGDVSALAEGEGELSDTKTKDKQSPNDFALWKTSKPGEPTWDSPWGKGRPGWHIECSAMASSVLGDCLDIHTGGVDLKFPHHDNELAQSEAYYDNDQWVRYFLHSGHLKIAGCKMSKSLKNFITIREALEKYSSQELRTAFLLHSWKDTLDYSDGTMKDASQFLKFISEFFFKVKDIIRIGNGDEELGKEETKLQEELNQVKLKVHEALCDNVDTPKCLFQFRQLVSVANSYIGDKHNQKKSPNAPLLNHIATYITSILEIFGLEGLQGSEADGIEVQAFISALADFMTGFRQAAKEHLAENPMLTGMILKVFDNLRDNVLQKLGVRFEDEKGGLKGTVAEGIDIMALISALSNVRTEVRQLAKEHQAENSKLSGILLNFCDKQRDEVLPSLGILLEDREGQSAVIKLVDKEILLKEKQAKQKIEEERRLEKEKQKREREEQQAKRDEQKKIPPHTMFLSDSKFSKFDEMGIPTHDIEGKELSKGQIKKMTKLYQAQEAKYNSYLASIGDGASL